MRGAKSANRKLFKDFCNEAKMEKNNSDGGSYFVSFTNRSEKKQAFYPQLSTFGVFT